VSGALLLRLAAAVGLALLAPPGFAEQADRDKPTQIEADRLSADDAKRVTIFEGNVVLTKGTISVRADRVLVRQDAEGYQSATATGNPVRFRQRTDARGNQPGVWAEAEALRVEIDDRRQKIELFEKARVVRDQDEVRGEYISLDQRTEVYTASAAKDGGAPEGRVRAVIQPKTPPAPPAGAPAERPPAR
jgi:lipopolysaccharide export system protein LptA